MKAVRDLTGVTFGDWAVVAMSGRRQGAAVLWWCDCACGTHREVLANSLTRGKSTGCGCRQYQELGKRLTKQGHSKTSIESRTYRSWKHIKQRCYNENRKDYKYYGGRGITLCDRWYDSFNNFLADMGECPPRLTIDRIDNDGNYEPVNCRWTTMKIQNQNKRGNWVKGWNAPSGENAPNAKLKDSEVAAIRQLNGKISQRQIAIRFGVSQALISMIHAGKIHPELRG